MTHAPSLLLAPLPPRSDLIIVDTSGRHKQEAALFEEMRQVAAGARLLLPAVTLTVHRQSSGARCALQHCLHLLPA